MAVFFIKQIARRQAVQRGHIGNIYDSNRQPSTRNTLKYIENIGPNPDGLNRRRNRTQVKYARYVAPVLEKLYY